MIIMIIFKISNTDWLLSWYTNTPVCYRQQAHSTGFGLKASFQDFKKRMKIERPRICKSCGSFHIVHIWQLEGGEGRSICICLIVCVCICICVSVFVFVYVLVYLYLYLCQCICIVPPRQLGGGKRILRSFSSAAHLQPVRWSGCWSAAVYFCSFSMPQINKIENNKSTFATGSLVVAEVMEGSDKVLTRRQRCRLSLCCHLFG